MRKITQIIVHGSATPANMDIGAEEIRRWHTDPAPGGNGWNDIGYHFVIRRNGDVEEGRDLSAVGAHVANHNALSIGVCLVGSGAPRPNYTAAQFTALAKLVHRLRQEFPEAALSGHYEFDQRKPVCPGFDVKAFFGLHAPFPDISKEA